MQSNELSTSIPTISDFIIPNNDHDLCLLCHKAKKLR